MFFVDVGLNVPVKERQNYEDVSFGIEGRAVQFVGDTIAAIFPAASLSAGRLNAGPNQPRMFKKVERVLADAFHAQAAALVQGGATAWRWRPLPKPGQRLHETPVRRFRSLSRR